MLPTNTSSDRDAIQRTGLGMKPDWLTGYFILSGFEKSRDLITQAPSGSQFRQTGLEPLAQVWRSRIIRRDRAGRSVVPISALPVPVRRPRNERPCHEFAATGHA